MTGAEGGRSANGRDSQADTAANSGHREGLPGTSNLLATGIVVDVDDRGWHSHSSPLAAAEDALPIPLVITSSGPPVRERRTLNRVDAPTHPTGLPTLEAGAGTGARKTGLPSSPRSEPAANGRGTESPTPLQATPDTPARKRTPRQSQAQPALLAPVTISATEFATPVVVATALAAGAPSAANDYASARRRTRDEMLNEPETPASELKRLKQIVQHPHLALGGHGNAAAVLTSGSAVQPAPQEADVAAIRGAAADRAISEPATGLKSVSPAPKKAGRKRQSGATADKAAVPLSEEERNKLNHDYCDNCLDGGDLLCCESCPRSFHLACADPPLAELPEGDWFCSNCTAKRDTKRAKHKGPFATMADAVATANPTTFRLPDWIRVYYEGVSTDASGAYRNDADRKGKFKNGVWIPDDESAGAANASARAAAAGFCDGRGKALLCFRCSKSAVRGPPLLVCDYCGACWHADCMDEPMVVPPGSTQKWHCPLHPETVLERTSKRIPRAGRPHAAGFRVYGPLHMDPIDQLEVDFDAESDPKRRARLPERSIVLDFARAAERERRAHIKREARAHSALAQRAPLVAVPQQVREAYAKAASKPATETLTDARLLSECLWMMRGDADAAEAGVYISGDEYRQFVAWRATATAANH